MPRAGFLQVPYTDILRRSAVTAIPISKTIRPIGLEVSKVQADGFQLVWHEGVHMLLALSTIDVDG